MSHIQLLVPTGVVLFYNFISSYKSFLTNFFNSKVYFLRVIFILILIFSILIINSNFLVSYYDKFVEYFDLYVLKIKFYSIEMTLYNFLGSLYYLILVLPFIRNNIYIKSGVIKFSSSDPPILITLSVIPKILFQPIFTISRVFSSFNFIFILAFIKLYTFQIKNFNQIYNILLFWVHYLN